MNIKVVYWIKNISHVILIMLKWNCINVCVGFRGDYVCYVEIINHCSCFRKQIYIFHHQGTEGCPIRSIVCTNNNWAYFLEGYIASQFKPLVGNLPSHIHGSEHFVQMIRNIKLETADILLSCDVKSFVRKWSSERDYCTRTGGFAQKWLSSLKQ